MSDVRKNSTITLDKSAMSGALSGGMTAAVSILVFTLLGRWIDREWGTDPWFTVLLALAGAVAMRLLMGDPVVYWSGVLEEFYAQLPDQDFGAVLDIEQQARLMSGIVLASRQLLYT